MRAFCCQCGRPVRQKLEAGKWVPGRCLLHPNAKRFSENWAQKWFRTMHDLVSGESLADQIAGLRSVRKPYLPTPFEHILQEIRSAVSGKERRHV